MLSDHLSFFLFELIGQFPADLFNRFFHVVIVQPCTVLQVIQEVFEGRLVSRHGSQDGDAGVHYQRTAVS